MQENYFNDNIRSDSTEYIIKGKKSNRFIYVLNIVLFLFTFFTTTMAGVAWLNIDPYQLENLHYGFTFSILIMLIITAHEFGHYFAAKYHKIDVTLPYYIPFPFLFLNPFGTMGAVIKMKSQTQTKKSLFDVGVAGPIAGWVITIIILLIGYMTVPQVSYLYDIHPDYIMEGIPVTGLTFGNNLTLLFFEKIFGLNHGIFIPPMNEIYHYPFLCAGWFGMLITSLNMMPVGQLDGGHISYAMFGENHKYAAYAVFFLLLIFGLTGLLPLAGIEFKYGSLNWLVWVLLILIIIKIKHPPVVSNAVEPLGTVRTLIGWFSYFIFITTFFPIPISDI